MKTRLSLVRWCPYHSVLLIFLCMSCARQVTQPTLNTVLPEYLAQNKFTANNAIVLNDNDLAFASKIDIIQQAEKELRLIYYIFDPDETTAYMTREILKKVEADSEFRVKLLTDYQYNYKNLDFFRWLENQQPHGKQQVEVRFYNRPGKEVIKFAEFMTMGCAKAGSESTSLQCTDEKLAYLKKYDTMSLEQVEDAMSIEAKIFLAGFYAKDPNGIQFGTQLGYARDVQTMMANPEVKPSMDQAQKENLKKVMRLYWASKTGNTAERVAANVQLSILGLFFGKELKPFLDGLETLLPFSVKDAQNTTLMTSPEISYITDYTHHKFLLADTNTAQIGGRNCANAYHMQPNTLEDKYIFMDTDFYMDLNTEGGLLFKNTFEKLWNFTEMVATTTAIEKHAPIGYLYLINQANKTAGSQCAMLTDPVKQMACAGQIFYESLTPGYEDLVIAMQEKWQAEFTDYLSAYNQEYLDKTTSNKPWTDLNDLFDSQNKILHNASINNPLHTTNAISTTGKDMYYVENVPYDLTTSGEVDVNRSFGSAYGNVLQKGKMIHKLWEDAFEAACAKSAQTQKPIEVIIHQGYFAPTEGMVMEMNRLMNKNICPNITLKIYTNSITTTDLTPINFIGRRQLYAMLQKNRNFHTEAFQYYEYDKDVLSNIVTKEFTSQGDEVLKGSYSLHSKVILFDDDIYIGSSNAEFRSYMMDTNNGVFIKDAPEMVNAYKKMLNTLEQKNIVFDAKSNLNFKNLDALRQQEENDIKALRQRYALDSRLFMIKRKQQFEYMVKQLYTTLEQVSTEMKKSLRKKKLEGPSKLDEMLKVF